MFKGSFEGLVFLGSVVKDQCNADMYNPIDWNRLIM